MTNILKISIFASLMTLMSFSNTSEITTDKRVYSYCNNTYKVDVCVWVRDWSGHSISLEYYKWQLDVPESKVDSVINSFMSGAIECKKNIDICLKKNK